MLKIDSSFNINNLIRFIMLHKIQIKNSFLIPKFSKIVCYFSLKNLEDLDDVKIYNYFYFFKFFLGYNAFVANYNMIQGYGKTTYNLRIQIVLCKNHIIFPLSFFASDLLPIVDKDYLELKFRKLKGYHVNLLINDMNIFTEKKTNIGLFNLKDGLNIKFFIKNSNISYVKLYFNHLKLYIE